MRARVDVGPPAPRVLSDAATLPQVLEAVNRNTAAVASYQTSTARIAFSGAPTVRANIAVQRPGQFRLRAETALTGPEVDLGSNSEEFWFWVRRAAPPAIYYGRHDCFAGSGAQQLMPVDPQWLIEALGLVTFDPAGQHWGPTLLGGNRLEIRSLLPSASGNLTKITVVDAPRGWVLEQHIYDPKGERLASALASQHRYDPVHGVSLPQHIEVQLPRAQIMMQIDTGAIAVNAMQADARELFTRPVYDGYTEVDLCRLPMAQQQQPLEPARPQAPSPVPATIGPQGTPWPLTRLPGP